MPESISSVAILGGSFNPLHFGHLRLGIEVYESLKPSRVDFVPCASPPHKPGKELLPFELRYTMLKEAVSWHHEFYVNPLEAEREGFSYTADTLREYARVLPGVKLYFVLGAEDFDQLESWKDWQTLPELAELLVVSRKGVEADGFVQSTQRLWAHCHMLGEVDGRPSIQIGLTGRVSYLSVPRLDINASLIRQRWLEGRSIDYWVPRLVVNVLRENYVVAGKHWQV